ncbi:phospholipid-binding protein MlaC [Vibrio algivorus]|uniref:Organic solvent ABC transporter substrate-binding protein n=1 Tax=Vibrio algivorus TaxID=1667024 RepID=A0ABQ6EQC7_9VIBR|nr:phospholipid-binding protein MlaC [Vibrio algivorus]GLT15034.1 organic solvent ABC transporter substrate-binding protein [Vibrio algivorus]
MSWIKKTALLLAFVGFAFSANAATVDSSNPYKMMHSVAEQTFDRLKAEQSKVQADPNYLKTIVEQEMMPYVNYQYTALKLLGPNLRGADKQQVGEFIQEFRAYLITSYAQVLTQYTDQTIQFAVEKTVNDDVRILSIPVEIIDTSRPNIKLEFTLLKNTKTGEWKAYDMVAEGISLLSSKQSEWNSKIRQDGIPAVTKELAQLAQKDIVFEGKK